MMRGALDHWLIAPLVPHETTKLVVDSALPERSEARHDDRDHVRVRGTCPASFRSGGCGGRRAKVAMKTLPSPRDLHKQHPLRDVRADHVAELQLGAE